MRKAWVQIRRQNVDFNQLASYYRIHPAIIRAIANRGVLDIGNYLGDGVLHLAIEMKDITKGASIIREKISNREKIRVIGDYDVDGVSASYILKIGLERCGADVSVVIPNRITDGYGINKNLIQNAYDEGIRTIITCDNGIAAIDAINYGKKLGMTIVVTDHHEIPYKEENGERVFLKSNADAIINPHQKEDKYPFKGLCGAAVAWKFIQALYKMFQIPQEEADVFIENAAFATISDVMDLQGENRTIVKKGLLAINNTQNIGLRALINESGLTGQEIKAYHIGFILAPCINASGRLEIAKHALDLLCTKNETEARELAEKLVHLNTERKALTEKALNDAMEIAKTMENDRVLVIYLPDCHESIAGIVAGKVREQTNKPVFVLTKGEKGIKGSGRSIEPYSMFEEMNKVSDVFLGFGGHPMAAGLSLEESRIDEFRKRINEKCVLTEDDLTFKIRVDSELSVFETSEQMLKQLSLMEPFGKGNPKPVFADRNLLIRQISVLGKDKSTCKLLLEKDGKQIEGMIFHGANEILDYLKNKYSLKEVEEAKTGNGRTMTLTISFDMSINEFRGISKPQVIINNYI